MNIMAAFFDKINCLSMRIGPLAESILIFSRLVFQRHLFLCCQICLLCYEKMR